MGNGPARPENYGERKPTKECGEWISPHGQKIELRLGDITMEDTTAIVNAANSRLMHGSGEVPTGQAVFTKGYWLWAPYVIHTVGPTWAGGKKGEPEELVSAVKNSLIIAEKKRWNSISIPAISSGIFGFPKELCAELMFKTVMEWFDENPKSRLRLVRFTNFDKPTVIVFQKQYEKVVGPLDESLVVIDDPPKKKPTRKPMGKLQRDSSSSSEEDDEDGEGEEKKKGKGKKGDSSDEDKEEEEEEEERGAKPAEAETAPAQAPATKVEESKEESSDDDDKDDKKKEKEKEKDDEESEESSSDSDSD